MGRDHPREPFTSVWRSWQRTCFGSTGSQVRDLPPRPVRAFGCGRSSMGEPWAVNPLVPVRLRPVTPKRMCRNASRTRAAEHRALTPEGQGSSPWRRTTTPPRGGIGRRTGLRNRRHTACPFDSDRGDQQQSGSSAVEQRPHKAKAGGSCPPRTTKTSRPTHQREGGVT